MFSPFKIELKIRQTTTEKEFYYKIDHIRSFVEKNKGVDITINENSVSFRSRLFGWTTDPFSQLDKGIFILSKDELVFKFYFIRTYLLFGLFFCFVAYQSQNIFASTLIYITTMVFNWFFSKQKFEKLLLKLSAELVNQKN
jgi:hypothetical protein